MQKIPSLFVRDHTKPSIVTQDVTPGCEWVIAGEGVATRKWDGSACMVRDGKLYKRYDSKKGKTPPPFFEPCQEPDAVTGHWPGWVPVGDEPESRWIREAFEADKPLADGTYECVGPKVNSNPEQLIIHRLIRHGVSPIEAAPLTHGGLDNYLAHANIEGIVWHHPDGRMCKIKARDFGHRWPAAVRVEP
jgi:hypothetical protein